MVDVVEDSCLADDSSQKRAGFKGQKMPGDRRLSSPRLSFKSVLEIPLVKPLCTQPHVRLIAEGH